MTTRQVEHEITVDAPAGAVYRLIAQVENWPRIFPPTIHVDRVEHGTDRERIRIWATAGDQAKQWTSLRTLDAQHRRITFRQEISAPPVAEMGGTWIVEVLSADTCRLRLLHDYRAIGDDPVGLAWIDEAVDRNSRSELAALKANVERVRAEAELTLSFEDTVLVDGSAKDLYDFVNEAHLWPRRLPHVADVELSEPEPGLQSLRMHTRAKDGSTHLTHSYRVCLPHREIIYKQTTLPALMTLHTGRWTFLSAAHDMVAATSQHTVVLNPENIERVLGAGATVADARAYVHGALSTNSLATLTHAKDHAEGAQPQRIRN
ncbi:aromatase/cyclase [Streptomyces sp. NPDC051576]|uniref:aromatase/cyclase n=1 Tax=Streptomyces sp. NPDC051576 TaxID=3155803 RepID=UPI003412994A